jgi:hypothetical protein
MNMKIIDELKELQPNTDWQAMWTKMKTTGISNKNLILAFEDAKNKILSLSQQKDNAELIKDLKEKINKLNDIIVNKKDILTSQQKTYIINEKVTTEYYIEKLEEMDAAKREVVYEEQ